MADTKISAMSVAGIVEDADILPIVGGGVNAACTRPIFLTSGLATNIGLTTSPGMTSFVTVDSGDSIIECKDNGEIEIHFAAGLDMTHAVNGGGMLVDAAGGVTIVPGGGNPVVIGGASDATLTLDEAAGTAFLNCSNGFQYTLQNQSATHWAGVPSDNEDAWQRIAAAVYALRGNSPIP